MSSYMVKKTLGDTAWYTHDRFGMFLHFGTYSLAARHEWMKKNEKMSDEAYLRYFDHFNPDLLDAEEWAHYAKKAGMKYAVLTTKHHEGFCLFDSQYTEYKSTNTPFGRDIVKEYVDAFRSEGIHVGLYYSLLDWHHPDFPIDIMHPRRDDVDAAEQDRGRDMKEYAQYMRDQVRELLTNYGKIDILWLDFSYPSSSFGGGKPWMQFGGGKSKNEWESQALIDLARDLQPGIIIDNRAGIDQDIWTPEQIQQTEWVRHEKTGELVTWEAAQTFSGSWGYYRDEQTWKSPKMLIEMLVNTVSLGGNLLLNVGPTGRGNFDYRAVRALDAYAEWMKFNGRSIYGCTMAEPEFTAPANTKLTQSLDEKRLYLHLQVYPFLNLRVPALAGKVAYMQFLHDASELLYKENNDNSVTITLPVVKPQIIDPVIEIFLK